MGCIWQGILPVSAAAVATLFLGMLEGTGLLKGLEELEGLDSEARCS